MAQQRLVCPWGLDPSERTETHPTRGASYRPGQLHGPQPVPGATRTVWFLLNTFFEQFPAINKQCVQSVTCSPVLSPDSVWRGGFPLRGSQDRDVRRVSPSESQAAHPNDFQGCETRRGKTLGSHSPSQENVREGDSELFVFSQNVSQLQCCYFDEDDDKSVKGLTNFWQAGVPDTF